MPLLNPFRASTLNISTMICGTLFDVFSMTFIFSDPKLLYPPMTLSFHIFSASILNMFITTFAAVNFILGYFAAASTQQLERPWKDLWVGGGGGG